MRNEIRKNLLAEYAVALVAERESWERLREPLLGEAERCRTFGRWKQTAARLKTLERQLRDAPPGAVCSSHGGPPPHSAQSTDEASLVRAEGAGKQEAVVPALAPVPDTSTAAWRRQPLQFVRSLVGGKRLSTT